MKSYLSKIIKIAFACLLSVMTILSLVQPSSIKAEGTMSSSLKYYNLYGRETTQKFLTSSVVAYSLDTNTKATYEAKAKTLYSVSDAQSVDILGAANVTIKIGATAIQLWDMGWVDLTLNFHPALSSELNDVNYYVMYENSNGTLSKLDESTSDAEITKDTSGHVSSVTIHKMNNETASTRGNGKYFIVAVGTKKTETPTTPTTPTTPDKPDTPTVDGDGENSVTKKIPVILKNTNTVAGYIKGSFRLDPSLDDDQTKKNASALLNQQNVLQYKAVKVNYSQWENDPIYDKIDQDNFTVGYYMNYTLSSQSDDPKWHLVYFPDETLTNGVDLTSTSTVTYKDGEVFYSTAYKKSGYYVLVETGEKKTTDDSSSDIPDPTGTHYWGSCPTMYESYNFFIRKEETPINGITANPKTFDPLYYQEGRDTVAYCFNKKIATPNGKYQIENAEKYNYTDYARYDMYTRSTGVDAFWAALNDDSSRNYAGAKISQLTYQSIAKKLDSKSVAETKNLLYEKMLYIMYNGYHGSQEGISDDPSGIKKKYNLSDTEFRKITAALVHYYTSDDISINGTKKDTDSLEYIYKTYKDQYSGLFGSRWTIAGVSHNNLITSNVKNATADLLNGLGATPVADRKLYIYNWSFEYDKNTLKKVMGSTVVRQNLINAEFYKTNEYFNIEKNDPSGHALSGAELTIYKGSESDDHIVYHYITDGTKKSLSTSMFESGAVYTLKETKVPDGYENFGSVQFKIENNKIVLVNDHPSVKVSGRQLIITDPLKNYDLLVHKKDQYGTYVKDAKLQLVKKDGTIVEEWTSNGRTHRIKNLSAGTYILKEVSAPKGYEKADDITIALNSKTTGKVYDVTMIDPHKKTLTVSKGWGAGTSPGAITVRLLKNGYRVSASERDDYKVTLNEANNWTYTWSHLDEDGDYSVEEETNSNGVLPVPTSAIKTYESITSFDSLKKGDQLVLVSINNNNQALGIQNGSQNAKKAQFRFVPMKSGSMKITNDKLETIYSHPSEDTLFTVDGDPFFDTNTFGITDDHMTIKIKSAAYNQLYIANKARSDSAYLESDTSSSYVRNMCLYNGALYFGGAIAAKAWNMNYDGSFYCENPDYQAHTIQFMAFKVDTVEANNSQTDRTFTFENQVKENQKAVLKVKKYETGHEDHYLAGAKFQLYKEDASSDQAIPHTQNIKGTAVGETFTTNAEGFAQKENLEPNKTYYLVEVEAPSGYKLFDDAIALKALGDEKVSQIVIENTNVLSRAYVKNGMLYIGNEKQTGVTLPDTGGSGTSQYVILGLLLIAISLIAMIKKYLYE